MAYEWYKQYILVAPERKKVARSFLSLTGVFFFCAICGYSMDIIGVFFPYYKIKIIFLCLLVPFTAWLVYAIKVNKIIAKIMGLEDKLEEALQRNKKEWKLER